MVSTVESLETLTHLNEGKHKIYFLANSQAFITKKTSKQEKKDF